MSPLLLADPGTRSARIAEPWVPGPSSYFLGHEILAERIILILEHKLWGREILTENFFDPSSCRRSVSNCWTLGCWAIVLSTRPRSTCWENNFGTSWWIMRSRNLLKFILSFLAGILDLNHLHPSTHTIFSSKSSQLAPSLPENVLA